MSSFPDHVYYGSNCDIPKRENSCKTKTRAEQPNNQKSAKCGKDASK